MILATRKAIAAEFIPFGSLVRIKRRAFVAADPVAADGVAYRCQPGDGVPEGGTVHIVTHGELLAVHRGEARWATVNGGKVRLDD